MWGAVAGNCLRGVWCAVAKGAWTAETDDCAVEKDKCANEQGTFEVEEDTCAVENDACVL